METIKPTIGILTSFYEFNSAYSLCSVVESQLTALKKYGYPTVLFVHDNFKDDDKVPEGVEIRKIVPRFELQDYGAHQQVNEDYKSQVDTAYKAFKENFQDIDIMMEHDMIFQGWFLPYCEAIHKLAKESKIKWFHWIHSVPNLMPKGLDYPHRYRYELPMNSKLVYLNNYHLIRAAESFSTFPKDVRIIYNPVDPRLFWNLHPLVKSLIDKYGILEADYLQIYPVSTPRMVSGKQVNIVIEIMGKLKKMGKKVCLVVCNAHANAEKDKQLVFKMLEHATANGLSMSEVIFTSLEDKPNNELGVPREVVSQLFQLSNLFVFPSISENCSLILLEAMLSKCLLVLNDSVPPLREFAGENALYFRFGGLDERVNFEDRNVFMEDVAKIIISQMSTNRALKGSNKIKQQFNYDALFKNSIEPLFYEQ